MVNRVLQGVDALAFLAWPNVLADPSLGFAKTDLPIQGVGKHIAKRGAEPLVGDLLGFRFPALAPRWKITIDHGGQLAQMQEQVRPVGTSHLRRAGREREPEPEQITYDEFRSAFCNMLANALDRRVSLRKAERWVRANIQPGKKRKVFTA